MARLIKLEASFSGSRPKMWPSSTRTSPLSSLNKSLTSPFAGQTFSLHWKSLHATSSDAMRLAFTLRSRMIRRPSMSMHVPRSALHEARTRQVFLELRSRHIGPGRLGNCPHQVDMSMKEILSLSLPLITIMTKRRIRAHLNGKRKAKAYRRYVLLSHSITRGPYGAWRTIIAG